MCCGAVNLINNEKFDLFYKITVLNVLININTDIHRYSN